MAKKDFSKTISGVDAFFTAAIPTETAEPEEQTPVQTAAPISSPAPLNDQPADRRRHARATYVFTLHLPQEWKEIISDAAWERRKSVTQLLVEIIGDWLKSNHKI